MIRALFDNAVAVFVLMFHLNEGSKTLHNGQLMQQHYHLHGITVLYFVCT